MTDVDQFLSGGGAPSASFLEVGKTYKGTIVSTEVVQQRDIKGNLKFWDDGQPMRQLVVTIQTDERDATIEDDDGQRRLFLKGSKKPESKSSLGAVIGALGKNKLARGGMLAVKYTGDGERTQAGFNPPKLYAAKYEPPVAQPDGIDDEEPF